MKFHTMPLHFFEESENQERIPDYFRIIGTLHDLHTADPLEPEGMSPDEVAQFRKESLRHRLIDEANKYLLHGLTSTRDDDVVILKIGPN